VNVPAGPRHPTLVIETTGSGTTGKDTDVDDVTLRALVDDLVAGRIDPDTAVTQLRRLPFADLGFARVDHHRALRQSMPEAVFAPGKTAEQCASIVTELLDAAPSGPVLLTRADADQIKAVLAAQPAATVTGTTVVWRPEPPTRTERVLLCCAGTADLPVANECATVLEAFGFTPQRLTDVGVAGLHRLLPHIDDIASADAVVAIAGMEGALASVVGGLASAPVVAVPTSVGYGAGLQGVTALLAMLASCAAGVTVVGIDNGYGAACAVIRMLGPRRS
jgi:pyridinium-3,5-biscarboxylic acid mononucleotide synthase